MAKATNSRERSAQMEMLRQAADGQMGPINKLPAEMQKDLRANKTLWARAVKNGVASGARKTTTKK